MTYRRRDTTDHARFIDENLRAERARRLRNKRDELKRAQEHLPQSGEDEIDRLESELKRMR